MNDAIHLLETLGIAGTDAGPALEALPASVREAWQRGDAAALARLLGGRATMACSVLAPEEDAPFEQPVAPDETPDEPDAHAA